MSLSVVLACALLFFTILLSLFSVASADAARVDFWRVGTSVAGGAAFGTIDGDQDHVYDGASELAAPMAGASPDTSSELRVPSEAALRSGPRQGYDDASNLTRASARPGGYRLAPNTTGRGADFVAGPVGSAPPVPVSQSRMAAGFDAAGFPRTPTVSRGMEYVLPDGSLVRLMQPSGGAPLRASFTNANGGPINPFTGKPVQPPAPPGWRMKDWVRALTHVEQTP